MMVRSESPMLSQLQVRYFAVRSLASALWLCDCASLLKDEEKDVIAKKTDITEQARGMSHGGWRCW